MARKIPPRRVPRDRNSRLGGSTSGSIFGGASIPGAHTHLEVDITDLDKYTVAAADTKFVEVGGDTMTGLLLLSGVPVADLGAATKKFVDDHNWLEADITDLQSYLLNITAEALGTLSDVTITAIASGELLKWNGSAFINNTLAEAGISATGHSHVEADISDLQAYLLDITAEALGTLSDVTITAIASGELLKWNGSAFINNTLAEAGISATGHTHVVANITDFDPTDYLLLAGGTMVGTLTAKNIYVADDVSQVRVGTGGDGRFYHQGTHTYLYTKTGQLRIYVADNSGIGTDITFYTNDTLRATFGKTGGFTLTTAVDVPLTLGYKIGGVKHFDVSGTQLLIRSVDTNSRLIIDNATTTIKANTLNLQGAAGATQYVVTAAAINPITDGVGDLGTASLGFDKGYFKTALTVGGTAVSLAGHTHTESDISDLQSYLLDITAEALGTLSDVTITAIASGELLKWNGSIFINNTLAEAGISATGHSHVEADISDLQSYLVSPLTTNGDVLYYNAGHQRLAKGSDTEVLTLASGVPTWAAAGGGVTDHGALTGLGDDDHTQYALLAGDTFTGTVFLTQNPGLHIQHTRAQILWEQTDAAVDNKGWSMRADDEELQFKMHNDAFSNSSFWLKVTRTGFALSDSVEFSTTVVRASGYIDATQGSGATGGYRIANNIILSTQDSFTSLYDPTGAVKGVQINATATWFQGDTLYFRSSGASKRFNMTSTYFGPEGTLSGLDSARSTEPWEVAYAKSEVVNIISNANTWLYVGESTTTRGSAQRGNIRIYGENGASEISQVTFQNTGSNLNITHSTGAIQMGSLLDVLNNKGLQIRDAGNTDWGKWTHDGTDLILTGTNTSDYRMTGFGSLYMAGNLRPTTTASHYLGSATFEWQGLYVHGTVGINLDGNSTLTNDATYTFLHDPAGTVKLWLSSSAIYMNATNYYFRDAAGDHQFTMTASKFGPYDENNLYDLGTSSLAWKDLWMAGNVNLNDGGSVIQTASSLGGSIWTPGGANWYSTASSKTGAITIKIPNDALGDMLSFSITIFEYVVKKAIVVQVSGYAYQTGGANEWVNETALILQNPDSVENYTVRFGHDGTNHLVYIGELADVWAYPQVQVFNLMSGFNTTIANYDDAWDVYWEASAFENIDATITDCTVGKGPMTTTGDILYYNNGKKRLAKGADDKILMMAGNLPTWQDAPAGGIAVTVSTSAPSGSADDGDLWCRV